MQGVYLVYELTDPASRSINVFHRLFFKNKKEHDIQILNLKRIKEKLDEDPSKTNTAIGLIRYDSTGTLTITPWIVLPKNTKAIETEWYNALKTKGPYFISHYIIQVKNAEEATEDIYTIPLYSKIFTDEKDQLIIYMTQLGDAFIVLEFKDNLLKSIHNNDLNTPLNVLSYPIFNPYTFNEFNRVYSFRFKIVSSNKTLHIYSPKNNISYRNDVCLVKPILQTRGFCYYHTVLHGLLISPNLQWICYYKLLKYMNELKNKKYTRYNLERFLNIDICEDFKSLPEHLTEDTRYFVMKFFYQYLFYYEEMDSRIYKNYKELELKRTRNSLSPIVHSHPIEVLVAHTYAYPKIENTLETIPEGGNAIKTLNIFLSIILELKITEFYKTKTEDSKDNEITYNEINKNPSYTKKYVYLDNQKSNDLTPIVYYNCYTYNYNESSKSFITDNKIDNIDLNNFNLEIAIIYIEFREKKTKLELEGSHAFIGINCNGKKYIIDSVYVEEYDWTSVDAILNSHHIKILYEDVNETETDKYELNLIIIWPYYIHADIAEKHTYLNPRETIKKLFIYPKLMKTIMDSSLDDSIKKKILYKEGMEDTQSIAKYEEAHPETWTLPARRGGTSNARKSKKKRLNTLTVKELQARCAKRKLAYAGLRKAELVALLRR